MQSGSIPFVRQNLAGAAALLLVCTGIWVFYLLLQAVIRVEFSGANMQRFTCSTAFPVCWLLCTWIFYRDDL